MHLRWSGQAQAARACDTSTFAFQDFGKRGEIEESEQALRCKGCTEMALLQSQDARVVQYLFNPNAGYGHMAAWYFGEIFAHPRVAGLDFYARLDTDSKITSPIRYDLFAFMRDNGFSYGWVLASVWPV